MTDERDEPSGESQLLHQFKNHLSIIVGFCDLLLGELPEADPKRAETSWKCGRPAT